jgi:hypothetical protein
MVQDTLFKVWRRGHLQRYDVTTELHKIWQLVQKLFWRAQTDGHTERMVISKDSLSLSRKVG